VRCDFSSQRLAPAQLDRLRDDKADFVKVVERRRAVDAQILARNRQARPRPEACGHPLGLGDANFQARGFYREIALQKALGRRFERQCVGQR
jgi:hypothetical protein